MSNECIGCNRTVDVEKKKRLFREKFLAHSSITIVGRDVEDKNYNIDESDKMRDFGDA